MLDVSRVNAQTIFCLNNGMNPRKYDSAEFSKQLAMSLILPHMATRRTKQGIQSSLLKKMDIYLHSDSVPPAVVAGNNLFPHPSSSVERRCKTCIEEIKGRGEKANKHKMHRVKTQCQRCEESVCKAHAVQVCKACTADLTLTTNEIEPNRDQVL